MVVGGSEGGEEGGSVLVESPAHYHRHIFCIKAVDSTFVPQSLRIPVDVTTLYSCELEQG